MKQNNALLQVSEIQLVYKPVVAPSQRLKVSHPSQAYKMLLDGWDMNSIHFVEHFKIVLLNKANRVLGVSLVSSGGIEGTVVDSKVIFAMALKSGASSLILSHNHPSGNLKPSHADVIVTKRIKEVGKILDIDVVDHLIISSEGYYSFLQEGVI